MKLVCNLKVTHDLLSWTEGWLSQFLNSLEQPPVQAIGCTNILMVQQK